MQARTRLLPWLACLFLFWIFVPAPAWPQAALPQSRIVQSVNESALVTLRGNTHPLAQAQFDRGAAPPDLPMARMLLVLQRSAGQESALQNLLDDQQDQNSPAYHQWLTPDAFGQQFGPSDQDIQAVTAWLRSHGFQVAGVGRGRTTIEFSGTALQVQQAFHTEIHKYTVNGEDHWANAGDPQIPQALSPVVAGVASLHNFPKQPMHRVAGVFSKSKATGQVRIQTPDFTLPNGNYCEISNYCYLVGPYDFAKIYNVQPLWNQSPAIDGTGQSIAIVGVSNINLQDVRDFRNLFGLPANDPQVILNGPDPGLVSGDETEADLDVEWSGAVAPGAAIKFVATASTAATDGIDLSALYIIENDLAPVMSESFGECELFVGTSGNIFENAIREQAAAEGITFINSSGDEGSARCDPYSGSTPDPATHGLAVSGLASSPHGVAVGGTDFANFGSTFRAGIVSPYWSLNNDSHQASVLGYVPETTWNGSCTNGVYVTLGAGSNSEASCNNPQLAGDVVSNGGGGGKSSCISSDGATVSSCTGGYAKPSWQSAPGVPADGARDIPDVSLFASARFMDSAYIVCEADQVPGGPSCSLSGLFSTFLGVGGTSASAPAFAGMMALVNQFTNSAGQGNANYVLYKLASLQSQKVLNCNASGAPASGCIFNDVTAGTIATPCAKGSPNCTVSNGADSYGVLSGYNAGTGYDLATGLGSVNAYNMVHNWILPSNPTSTTLTINNGNPVSITHGQSTPLKVVVTPTAATGDISLIGSPGASGSVAMGTLTLQNGAANGTTAMLAGGNSYQVKAHYAGDGNYAPSDSNSVTVTVAPEVSKTLISIPVFDPTTGKETGDAPASLVYGSPYIARVDVGNAAASLTFPMSPVCATFACPTGSVTLMDSLNGGSQTPLGTGLLPLNPEGYAEYESIQLLGGSHQLSASFAGDNSYGPSSGSYALMITPAPTQVTALGLVGAQNTGDPIFMSTDVISTALLGAEPTGQVTFYDGVTPIPGTVTFSGQPGTVNSNPSLHATLSTTFTTNGTHPLSAKYSGDANYAAGISPTTNLAEFYPTTVAEKADFANINPGQSVTITATVTGASKAPPMTGTFQFVPSVGNPAISSPATLTQGVDANGNQTLTASVSTTPQISDSVLLNYSGDANYAPSSGTVFVNVVIPDFNFGANAPSLTLNAGQSGMATLTVIPLTNLSSMVSLSCDFSGIAGASCSMNPASPISISNGTAVSTVITVSTLPPSGTPTTTFVAVPRSRMRHLPPPARWLLVVTDGLAILILSLWPGRRRRRPAASLSMVCLLCLVAGCGAGSTSGGGGGGGLTPTALTLSTSAVKAPFDSVVTFTATVNGSQSATGSVSLLDGGKIIANSGIVNGTAVIPINGISVGTHVITAQYNGDLNNSPSSTKGSINQVITGITTISVVGMTGQISHQTNIFITIQ